MANSTIADLTDGVTADATDRLPVARSPFASGDNRYITPAYLRAYGAATWNTVAAASGDATTSNTTNRIVYQTAPTADSRIAWRFTESSAGTNGTSTAGVPNQVLLRVDTIAASTQSPLSVYSRATHVFSVSPTAAQILATSGSNSAPTYAFAAGTNDGMYLQTAGLVNIAAGGTAVVKFASNGVNALSGSGTQPSITDFANQSAGLFFGANILGISVGVENARFISGAFQPSFATASATGYAINARKSRGTVASPSVITTGDDVLTINGAAYVGSTGTYVTAATLTIDSTGTIADNSTGVGGIFKFATRKVAGSVTERLRVDENEAASETSLMVSENGGAVVRVSIGAADSGGSGFRVLRIPN